MAKKRRRPAKKSAIQKFIRLMESEPFIGAVQVAGVLVGVLGLLWTIFAGDANAEGRKPPEIAVLTAAVAAEDLRQLQSLHSAIDIAITVAPNEAKYKDADRVIDTFMDSRSEILKRHELSSLYQTFYKRFEEYTSTPTLPNRLLMRQEAVRLTAALDAVTQKIAHPAKR